jgi:hypothetical protein
VRRYLGESSIGKRRPNKRSFEKCHSLMWFVLKRFIFQKLGPQFVDVPRLVEPSRGGT